MNESEFTGKHIEIHRNVRECIGMYRMQTVWHTAEISTETKCIWIFR